MYSRPVGDVEPGLCVEVHDGVRSPFGEGGAPIPRLGRLVRVDELGGLDTRSVRDPGWAGTWSCPGHPPSGAVRVTASTTWPSSAIVPTTPQ